MAQFDRDQAIRAEVIHHNEDHSRNHRRLQGLYGKVACKQNQLIIDYCVGNDIMDVGAGYGNLSRQLIDAGKNAIPLEVDTEKARLAAQWLGVTVALRDFYTWENKDGQVDTIIFREVLNHLAMDKAFSKAFDIVKHRCLIFQGTEILPVRIMKNIYGHKEFDQKTIEQLCCGLEQAGFRIQQILYTDPLAFPLSGGWHGHSLCPPLNILHSLVLNADALLTKAINGVALGRHVCFRSLIVADKP